MKLMAIITESEWYGDLREELEVSDSFLSRVAAVGRVAGKYAFRLVVFFLVLAALVYFIVQRNAG